MTLKTRHILLTILLIAAMATGCTRNGGDIGPLFGNWRLDSIDAEGDATVPQVPGTVFWSFQSSTIHTYIIEDHYTSTNGFGNYRLIDNTLHLEFPDDDPGHGLVQPPILPSVCELQLLRLTSRKLILKYEPQDTDGALIFNFSKY